MLTITKIKDEMEKTLQWLVPVATNTAKTQDFDFEKRLRNDDRLSKSTSHPPPRESKEKASTKRLPSRVPIIGFAMYKEKTLDLIDNLTEMTFSDNS
ncbi:hypothetical protein CRYUN_Cryun17cG0064200 [Craigia yunnanensis]